MAMYSFDRARLERNLRESGLNDEATRAVIELIDQGIKEAVREQFAWLRYVGAVFNGLATGALLALTAVGLVTVIDKVLGR